jgi:hypothetical protein
MAIRKDKGLRSVTSRLKWWLFSNSHSKGYAWATGAKMAEDLSTNVRQISISLKVIEDEDGSCFKRVVPKGLHRAHQWHRVYLTGETRDENELKSRIQNGRFNVAVRLHWDACDETAETGEARFSVDYGVSDQALRQARSKMNRLGHFQVDSGRGGRGIAATYRRATIAGGMKMEKAPTGAEARRPGKPMTDEERRERKLDRAFEAWNPAERYRRERAQREAEIEFGPATRVIPVRHPKRVVRSWFEAPPPAEKPNPNVDDDDFE